MDNLRDNKLDSLSTNNHDMKRRRTVNASAAVDPNDYIIKEQLDAAIVNVSKKIPAINRVKPDNGEFSFQAELLMADPGVLVMINNFSVDLTQKQRVNFCYSPAAIVSTNLIVHLKISTDEGSTWTLIEILTILVGSKHSWPIAALPKDQFRPYNNNTIPLNAGDQLNFTLEAGSCTGLTIKMDTLV